MYSWSRVFFHLFFYSFVYHLLQIFFCLKVLVDLFLFCLIFIVFEIYLWFSGSLFPTFCQSSFIQIFLPLLLSHFSVSFLAPSHSFLFLLSFPYFFSFASSSPILPLPFSFSSLSPFPFPFFLASLSLLPLSLLPCSPSLAHPTHNLAVGFPGGFVR